jgi:predicted metal-binding protein
LNSSLSSSSLRARFKLDGTSCLGCCDNPCALELRGKKRSTYTRVSVRGADDVELVVRTARAYAALAPGEEIPERSLPGESGD